MTDPQLTFLKLGGSLITAKTRPHTPRRKVVSRLAEEIAGALAQMQGLRLVLGHGSGSFGHVPAREHGTRQGVQSPAQWRGFAEVWFQASSLNRLVVAALREAGVACIAFPPSAAVTAEEGRVVAWNLDPLHRALHAGLVPVVYGDVVFDRGLGGTILSTEDLFAHLARQLRPGRILLAGLVPGVWESLHLRTRVISKITPENLGRALPALGEAEGADVTGGMNAKVMQMLDLVQELPDLEVLIFSGEKPGNLRRALAGEKIGTHITR